jgi:hypothetical protein
MALKERSMPKLGIFHARIFYKHLINVKQELTHIYETMQRINVCHFIQATDQQWGRHAKFQSLNL